MKIKYVSLFAFLLLFTVSLNAAPPDEYIKDFKSKIHIQADGKIVVAEKITVNCERIKIRRGIIRYIPTKKTAYSGAANSIAIHVLGVYRNGKKEPFKVYQRNLGVEIHVGSDFDILRKGEHTFEILYVADRVIRGFDGHDELYWNVTGNFWDFPIRNAVAWVTLPEDVEIQKTTAFTGRYGQKGSNYEVKHRGHTAFFKTNRALLKEEGLTICVGWPKGYITPYEAKEFVPFIPNSYSYIFIAFPCLLVLFFNCIFYMKFRKQNYKNVSQDPPNNLSPSEASYLYHMEFREEAVISMLVDLHFRQYITISKKDDGDYLITRRNTSTEGLSKSEYFVLNQMFGKESEFVINNSNRKKLKKILYWLKKDLKRQYRHCFTDITQWKRGLEICLFVFFTPFILFYEATYPFFLYYALGCCAYLWLSNNWKFRKPKKEYENQYEHIQSFKNFLDILKKKPKKTIERSRYKVTAETLKKYIPYMVGFKVIDDWNMDLVSGFKHKLPDDQVPASCYMRGFGTRHHGFNRSFSHGCTRSGVGGYGSGFGGGGGGFGGGGFSGGGFGGGGGGGR